jgi:hypothetical protein
MADNDKPKFDIPWGTLLPLIAVLAGVVAHYKPLVSNRPTVPSEKTIPVIAAQDVDARLWQDPFSVAEKQKSSLDEQIEVGVAKKGTTESHNVCALVELLRKRATEKPERVLVLAVMVDAGPYSEQGESRLRARPAVLEALSESGFICRNKFWPRFIRIGVLFTLYFLFSFIIFRLFPPPPAPAGATSHSSSIGWLFC